MGRSPCCDKSGLKKGPWAPEEDSKLTQYINAHGAGNWRSLQKNADLQRCPKSCRLRWTNYLRPDIKRGRFSFEEEETIIQLHSVLGNKWSGIAAKLLGRTDNEIKNYWNTHIRKRLLRSGIDLVTHAPRLDLLNLSSLLASPQLSLHNLRLQPLLNPNALSLAMTLLSSSQLATPILQPNHFENIIDQQIPSNLNINSFQNQSQSLGLDNAIDNQQILNDDLHSFWSDGIRVLDETSSFDQSMNSSSSSNNNRQNFSLDSTPLSSPFTSAIMEAWKMREKVYAVVYLGLRFQKA